MDWWTRPYDMRWWGALAVAFALSATVTWLAIRYAHYRNLIDLPGQRRSHAEPTPRGGGIGIVIACIALVVPPLFAVYPGATGAGAATLFGLVVVAAIGWWDDHFGLSALARLCVHALAALVLAHALMRGDGVVAVGVFAFAVVWSINLHNFMDGINGILAIQALFVFALLGWLGLRYAQPVYAVCAFAAAAATLGYLPFNFPRARVFMGDVGSGALGFLIAAAIGVALDFGLVTPAQALVIVSAFMIDTCCTLASRIVSGRRWYRAHREHLYQWLARAMSHAGVTALYVAWNLLVVVPAMLVLEHVDGYDDAITAAVYVLGIALWVVGKRQCLNRVKSRRHA